MMLIVQDRLCKSYLNFYFESILFLLLCVDFESKEMGSIKLCLSLLRQKLTNWDAKLKCRNKKTKNIWLYPLEIDSWQTFTPPPLNKGGGV